MRSASRINWSIWSWDSLKERGRLVDTSKAYRCIFSALWPLTLFVSTCLGILTATSYFLSKEPNRRINYADGTFLDKDSLQNYSILALSEYSSVVNLQAAWFDQGFRSVYSSLQTQVLVASISKISNQISNSRKYYTILIFKHRLQIPASGNIWVSFLQAVIDQMSPIVHADHHFYESFRCRTPDAPISLQRQMGLEILSK